MNSPDPTNRDAHSCSKVDTHIHPSPCPVPPWTSTLPLVAKCITDDAKPIKPELFPNGPQGWNKILPATLANLTHLLREYEVKVVYDCIKKKLRIVIPGQAGTTDNADNTAITTVISLVTLNGMAIGQVPALIEAIGDRNIQNPVLDWINSRRWDGTDRLPSLFDTLKVREGFSNHLKKILVYKWLLSATAAAVLPRGFKARGVLTFQGPQGIGKTSWVMSLVNDPALREMLIKVDHHLDPHNKDSILGAITHWIVEIGELDSSFRKSDVSRLKGVLTSDSDKVRRPYAKTESEYQRRTVFCATVNEENFLVDNTGNTRWWTLPLVSIDFQHGIDMQQIFAQLSLDVAEGKQWWLTQHEEDLLEHHNRDHRSVSLMRNRLMEKIDLTRIDQPSNTNMGTTELLGLLGVTHPTNGDAKELTSLLKELLGSSKRVNGTQKWRMPWREGYLPPKRY
jgi:predicted P-loop ATPase